MFLVNAQNENAALPTFKDKSIRIYPSGYCHLSDVQKDSYHFGVCLEVTAGCITPWEWIENRV